MIKKQVHLAVSYALGLTAFLSVSGQVLAQNQDADASEFEDSVMEEVIVTGSRIKRADLDSASPVTVLTRADIELSGMTDVGMMLQRLPIMAGAPVNTTSNGADGSVGINLRNMGPERSLILVNGNRMLSRDMQTVPSTMIERIEILKDGASAIYGADAVSGVVNIITRRDFDGIELSAQHTDWQHARGMQNSVGLISGTEWETGNFVFGAEYVDQEEAYQRDVPWEFLHNTYYIYPEGCENQVAAPYDGTPEGGCYQIGSSRIPEGRLQFYSQGRFLIGDPATAPYEVGEMIRHDFRDYNYAPVNYLQMPYTKTNIFTEGHFELTDNVRFNMEIRGSFRESAAEFAPIPLTGGDPMHDGIYVDPDSGESVRYTGVSEDNYYLKRAVDAYNAANGASLIYEPLIQPRRRMIEATRRLENSVTQYQWTAGLEGRFRQMDWEVYLDQGIRNLTGITPVRFAGDRLHNAMGPSADLDGDGQPECYADINDPGSLIPACVPLNLFGGGSVDENGFPVVTTVTPDMIDYLSIDAQMVTTDKQRLAGAILTGSHFELPGGELGWAVGWSYRKQETARQPDSSLSTGDLTGNNAVPIYGSLTNNALFGEFLAPLYDNGTQSFYLKGGLRYDDWSQFGSDTTYQLGVEFQAFESLKLRATYGTVFRVPTMANLFTGLQDSFRRYSDPCIPPAGDPLPPGCAQEGVQEDSQVRAQTGGNPNLQPEHGDTFTAGLVWTPQFGDHGLTMTVDYWDIYLEDAIDNLGVQFILNECYIELSQPACALITRNPDYSVEQVIDTFLNVGVVDPRGVDTEIRWNYPGSFGLLQASLLWTHTLASNQQSFEGDEVSDNVGKARAPQDKVNLSLQWMLNDWSVSYFGEYISAVVSDTFYDPAYLQQISSFWYHDLTASYTFGGLGGSTQLSAGIRNITNEAPPFIETGVVTTDVSTYRLFGRGYYLNLKWKF